MRWTTGLLLLLALALGAVLACERVAVSPSESPTPSVEPVPSPVPEDLRLIWEVYKLLKQDYVDQSKIDPNALSEAAVKAMMEAVNDPYSSYIGPGLFNLEQDSLRGSFEGIGAVVGMRDGKVTVISPIAGGPAEKAGIRGGDIILEVNDEPVANLSLNETVLKIRGPKGTKVKLLLQRSDKPLPEAIELVRDEVALSSVYTENLSDGFVRLQITQFAENTDKDVSTALRQIRSERAKGIVLDLRNNPGGYLHTTVNIASQFLDGGTVVYELNSDGSRREWKTNGIATAKDIPLVVLVNKASASGSEVLAGALQDRGRAKLVGTLTFGKGSVNLIRTLSNGGGLYITTARWLTPSGRLIEGHGLDPDIQVDEPTDSSAPGDDPQLKKAVEVLQEQVVAQSPSR